MPISLRDSGKRRRFGTGSHTDADHWRADLHLLYPSHLELRMHCTGGQDCECPSYTKLWSQVLDSTGQQEASKAGLLAQLLAWHEWAQGQAEQSRLSAQQVELCYAPNGAADIYDRAVVSEVRFTCT